MLRDRKGVSHHTAAEVYLNNIWQYIDPWLGVFPQKSDGTGYTRFEFAKDQTALIRYGYAPGLTGYEFAHSVVFETFPFMSLTGLVQKTLAKLGNLHESSTPGGLSNVANNNGPTGSAISVAQIRILKLYDKARAMHLAEDFNGARAIYLQLLQSPEIPTIGDSARFFFGVTYFDEHKYDAAEKYFKLEIANHPKDLWINSEYRFLSESLIAQGKIAEAKLWLKNATSQGAQTRLRNLDGSISSALMTIFISH